MSLTMRKFFALSLRKKGLGSQDFEKRQNAGAQGFECQVHGNIAAKPVPLSLGSPDLFFVNDFLLLDASKILLI